MPTPSAQATPGRPKAPRKREWAPRVWEGCDFFAWLRLLARNRFAVQWPYLYIAFIVTVVSVFHTLLRFLQEGWYGQRVRRTRRQQVNHFAPLQID